MYAQLNPYLFISLAYAITLLSLCGYALIHLRRAHTLKQLILQQTATAASLPSGPQPPPSSSPPTMIPDP